MLTDLCDGLEATQTFKSSQRDDHLGLVVRVFVVLRLLHVQLTGQRLIRVCLINFINILQL